MSESPRSLVRNNTVRRHRNPPGTVRRLGSHAGVTIERSDRSRVRNNEITGAQTGIAVRLSSDVTVGDNLLGNHSTGLGLLRATRLRAVDNRIVGSRRRGIAVIRSDGITLARNVLRGNDEGIVLTAPRGTVDGSDGATIAENRITDGSGYGVSVQRFGVDRLRVADNEIRNNRGGVALTPFVGRSNGVAVVGNEIVNNTEQGIDADRVDRFRLLRNSVRGNGGGVGLGNAANVTVAGNRIANNTEQGVRLERDTDSRTVRVRYNVVANNGDYGIENRNETGLPVLATNNWWGSRAGPSSPFEARRLSDPVTGAPTTPTSTGDAVSEGGRGVGGGGVSNVRFDPWLRTPPAVGPRAEPIRIRTDRLGRS